MQISCITQGHYSARQWQIQIFTLMGQENNL